MNIGNTIPYINGSQQEGIQQPRGEGVEMKKEMGVLGSHLFHRLTVDNSSRDQKANSVAVAVFTEKPSLKNTFLEMGVKMGKYIKTDVMTVDSNGTRRAVKIAVNVRSLAKRLEVGPDSPLFSQEKSGGNAIPLGRVLTDVHTVMVNEDLNRAFSGGQVGLTRVQDVTKVFIDIASEKAESGKEYQFKEGVSVKVYGKIVVNKDTMKPLGKGSYGVAETIDGFLVGTFSKVTGALKTSRLREGDSDFEKKAKDDIQQEAANLQFIAKQLQDVEDPRIREGLQDPPTEVSYNTQQGFLIGKRYETDLLHVALGKPALSSGDKLHGVDRLVRGLAFTQSLDLVHTDIKPQNIFLDSDDKFNPIFKLADWGGARFASHLSSSNKPSITLKYIPKEEGISTFHQASEANKNALQQLSSFSLGASIFEILAGSEHDPYPREPIGSNEAGTLLVKGNAFNREALKGYPEEVVDFIALLLDEDPTKRPVGQNLVDQWNGVVNKHGSLENLCEAAQALSDD